MTNLEEVVWAQEEPKNQGYWSHVEPRIERRLGEAGLKPKRPIYAGREPAASPATGLAKRHAAEQAALIADALGHSSARQRAEGKRAKEHGDRSQSPDAGRIDHRGDARPVAEAARRRRSKPDEPIASLETDKVAVEVPAPVAGTMGEQLRQGRRHGRGRRGDRASSRRGAGARGRAGRSLPEVDPGQSGRRRREYRAPRRERPTPRTSDEDGPHLTLSPAVRRIVLEHHLDPRRSRAPARTAGSPRTTCSPPPKAQKAEAAAPAPAPAPAAGARAAAARPPPAKAGERREERVRMTRLRQTVARRLKEAQNTAAMLTTFNDVDMSAVMDGARALQGSVREEARHPARLHGLLREGGGARRARRARGQRLDRGRGDRLPRLCRRLGRGLGAATAWSCR